MLGAHLRRNLMTMVRVRVGRSAPVGGERTVGASGVHGAPLKPIAAFSEDGSSLLSHPVTESINFRCLIVEVQMATRDGNLRFYRQGRGVLPIRWRAYPRRLHAALPYCYC